MNTFSKDTRKAFTLVEIMVAAAITVIMVGLVVQITGEVLKIWNRSSGKLSANAEARIAMDLLTSDLETAVMLNNGAQWLRSENVATGGPGGKTTVALRLFAPALDRDTSQPGNICAIAYQLERRDPVTGLDTVGDYDDRLWILYRMVVDPRTTFDDLMGAPNQNRLPDQGTTNWLGNDIIGDEGENYLAQNIVQFEVNFYVVDDGDNSTPRLVDGDTIFGGQGATPTDPNDATVGAGADAALADHFKKALAYAEIHLTVISDEGAGILQQVSGDALAEEQVILEHGEVFKRRVYFHAKPL